MTTNGIGLAVSSWQMHVVAAYTRIVYRRDFTTAAGGQRKLAGAKGSPAPPRWLAKRYDVTCSGTHGFDVYRVRAQPAGSRDVVVYLHGGAYTSEIVKAHWSLIGSLAAQTGLDIHVPIYGLSPAHHGLEALRFVTQLVTELAGQGHRCYLAGDSAGGGLALLAAQAVAGRSGGVAGLTLLAPWLDLSMCNPGIDEVEPHDPWLTRPGLRPLAAAWANGLPLEDPRLSPIYGDLSAVPPVQVLVGTRDITLPDCRALRDRLPAGTALTYHEEEGAIHVYPLLPVPEARGGRQSIVDHIRAVFGNER
jgi:epsilon-lactone hydrolase